MNKSPILAFFLSFIPGVGHFYLNRKAKGYLYVGLVVATILVGMFASIVAYGDPFPMIVAIMISIGFTIINVFDMILFLIKNPNSGVAFTAGPSTEEEHSNHTGERDRFYAILLSFIPGLGHFQLGLMNRGLTFLVGFFGIAIMVIFITAFTGQGEFMVFLGILPIIWVYNMFDAIQQINKKQRGEELVDKTILEDFEETRLEQGKKSKSLATVFSIFPGAGHLYLGLQKRGIQLMAAFLFAIYILDTLRLSLFLFLIPIIWFYSFFDALQKVSKHGEEELEDIPVISYFINHQKWLGIGLIALGLYYMFDSIVVPAIGSQLRIEFGFDLEYWYYNFFQMGVICILLIGGGLKLILGSKNRKENG